MNDQERQYMQALSDAQEFHAWILTSKQSQQAAMREHVAAGRLSRDEIDRQQAIVRAYEAMAEKTANIVAALKAQQDEIRRHIRRSRRKG